MVDQSINHFFIEKVIADAKTVQSRRNAVELSTIVPVGDFPIPFINTFVRR